MASTEDTNIVVDRDYSDNFSIKDTAISKLGTKYFGDVELAGLNVGALGFTLEQIGNITEDAFNTVSILLKESFPNKATIPESIYSHAAVFQLNNAFASCAQCSFVLMLEQKDILEKGTTENGITTFYLDKKTSVEVEGIPFTLDYDIKIEAQKKQITGSATDYNFSAQYVIDSTNSISSVNDPYLKIRKTSNGYLILQVTMHQVERLELTDTIINNTKVNYPVLEFDFEGTLAGFDIFYKAPTDSEYTQLTTLIAFSIPIKTPFCYYRLIDEQTLRITFSSKDGYFQPDFNSEIKIVLYTTLGEGGNFEVYNGSSYEFQLFNDVYEYNEGITIAGKTVSDSAGGGSVLSLEGLQALTVENYSTATELSTENDLTQYFYNFKYRYGNEILVIKRRDDITERLFSTFLLMKNEDYIYPTNTLNLDLTFDEFDTVDDTGNRYSLNPGHVFVYENDSMNTMKLLPDIMCYDTEAVAKAMEEYDFVYTNPLLISLTKSPNAVGLYQTIVNQTEVLDYISSNANSFTQFITSKITLQRGLSDDHSYDLSLSIVPSSSMDPYIENLNDYHNDVRVIASFCNSIGEEVGYIEMLPTAIDEDDETAVTFTAKIEMDDIITSTSQIGITNAVRLDGKSDNVLVPITGAVVNIYVLYDDAITLSNRFSSYFDNMKYYSITNTYSAKTNGLTFVKPMNMMRSTATFSIIESEDKSIGSVNLSLLPMIRADIISDEDNFNVFISRLSANYEYLEECLPQLRNNTHLDVKFFNTYGKSSNYYIGDNYELIDTINIKIGFKVVLVDGTDDVDITENIKTYIKEFIEQLNSSGTNDLYISNLIKGIENKFTEVHHLKFLGINDYSTDYQTIIVKETDLTNLTKEERRKYVPEMLVVDKDNINLAVETVS
jgi:hypothetical protein